jgi:UDP-N-acetylmuramoyl-L-alanyl-D-glutamate--2,6-diaminopimelate ligase
VAVVLQKEQAKKIALSGQQSITWIRVPDAREALFSLAATCFGRPAEQLRLVGVTGTNGKTTTTFLVQALLNESGRKSGLIGTIHYDLSGRTIPATETTPGILDLQTLFATMKAQGATYVVMEASSHSLDQRRTLGLSFDAAVFTNLTQDHLDYHQTMEAYFEAKKKLFAQTRGLCVINIDDPWGRILQSELKERALCYGIDRHDAIYPKSISMTLAGIQMLVETPLGEIPVSSALTGQYNVYNLLGAVGVGVATGLSKEAISAGLSSMRSVPGRFEKIDLGQDFLVIVDYAHTEDALARLLQSVCSLSLGHVITVIGCGGDRDRGKRPKMGNVASLYSRLSILTSDNPRSEAPLSIIREMEDGIAARPDRSVEVIPDRSEAIARAIFSARSGDAVVIAGKGHETYQIIGKTRLPFDDRECARRALLKKLRKS